MRRASRYCSNFDGRVSKDGRRVLRGGYAIVYSGNLRQREDVEGTLGGGHVTSLTKVNSCVNDDAPPLL